MYKIFLDKSKIFECDIDIEGASLSESVARLYLQAGKYSLVFDGDIKSNGSVSIPLGKLKGVLEENYTGKISLEVIAEDTRFTPWVSQYHTDVSKKVSINENSIMESEAILEEVKPRITFKLKEEKVDVEKYLFEIEEILSRNRIEYNLLYHNLDIFEELIETYLEENRINDMDLRKQIKEGMLVIIKP